MADVPLLSIRDLKTYFFPDEGMVKAVDGASFDIPRARRWASSARAAAARASPRARSSGSSSGQAASSRGEILLRPTHGSESEAIDLAQLKPDGRRCAHIRGGEIALRLPGADDVVQPGPHVGDQIIEAILLHQKVSQARGARARRRAAAAGRRAARRGSAWTSTPSSFRAACVSGR